MSTTVLAALIVAVGAWTALGRVLLGGPYLAAVLDVGLALLVIVAAVRARRQAFRFSWLDVAVGAYVVLAVVEMANPNVPSPVVALEGFRKTAFTMAAYALIRLTPRASPRTFYAIAGAGLCLAFLWSIRQFIVPIELDLAIVRTAGASPTSFNSGPVLRAYAPTPGPFHLGLLAGSVVVIALALARADRRWIVALAIACIALAMSLTRGNILATIVAIGVVAVAAWPIRLHLPRIGLGAAAALVIVATSFGVARTANVTPLTEPDIVLPGASAEPGTGEPGSPATPGLDPLEDRSLRFRIQFWLEYAARIAERPIVGYGTSSAGDGLDRYYAGTGSLNFEPHSLYLKSALELGVGGLVLMLAILGGGVLAAWRTLRREPWLGALGLGLLALIGVSGLTGPMLDAHPANVLFWATLGFLANTGLGPLVAPRGRATGAEPSAEAGGPPSAEPGPGASTA